MPYNNLNTGTAANNGTGDNLRLGGQKINANFAYIKQYADNLIQGNKWKNIVDAATTANITLSGEQTIDGVTTSASRILVKDQTDKTENGIYLTGAGAWTRTTDADTGPKLVNATVSVKTINSNEFLNWTCNAENITLGSTDIEFVPFQGSDGIDQGTFDAAIQIINTSLAEKADADHTHTADDVTETATKKWTSPTEKNTWNGKETTTGAQSKADAAQTAAEQYADAAVADLELDVVENTDNIAVLDLNKANDSEVVKLSGDQTIDDVKTFSSSPKIPDAVNNDEPVSKGQLDTAIAGVGGGGGSYTPPADYTDKADLLANQGSQVTGEKYTMLNANGWNDPEQDAITHNGWATVKYLGTTNGDESDYDLREQFDVDDSSSTSIGWVNVLDYGADPTGATSNTSAFEAAQNAITGNAGVIYVPEGEYLFSSEFNVTKRITFIGEGSGKNYGWFSSTKIISKTNITLWRISAAGVNISDIGFEWHGSSNPTSAKGLYILNTDTDISPNMTANDKSQSLNLYRVSVRGFYDNIFIEACATWDFDKLFNVAAIRYGLHVQNTTSIDSGDWCISNSMFFQPMATPGGSAIYQVSSGGGKITNTKFNGAWDYGVRSALNDTSSILLISNSSFENFANTAIKVTNHNFVSITGCQISSYRTTIATYCIDIDSISTLSIVGNCFVVRNIQNGVKVTNSSNVTLLNSYEFSSSGQKVIQSGNVNFFDLNELNTSTTPIPRSQDFNVAAADNKRDNYCSAALTVTVLSNTSEPIPIGFESHYWQTGTGAVTFIGESGVTINKDASELLEIAGQHNAVTLKKISTDTWVLIGGLKKP